MSHLARHMLFVLSISIACSAASAFATDKITSGRYVAGGALGTFVGFGIGHAVQKRNWVAYTLLEGAGVGLMLAGAASVNCSTNSSDPLAPTVSCNDSSAGLVLAGALLFGVTRVVEIVSVWIGPEGYHATSRRSNTIERTAGVSPWIKPVIPSTTVASTGVAAGLALRF